MSVTLHGKCLCGRVEVPVAGGAGWIGVCHCSLCRRWSGGLWAGFPAAADAVSVSGPVKTYASSALAERAFCAECGTQLWMRDLKDEADFDLMPGIFEDAAIWPLKNEIYVDEAYAAFALNGSHVRATAAEYRSKTPAAADVPHG